MEIFLYILVVCHFKAKCISLILIQSEFYSYTVVGLGLKHAIWPCVLTQPTQRQLIHNRWGPNEIGPDLHVWLLIILKTHRIKEYPRLTKDTIIVSNCWVSATIIQHCFRKSNLWAFGANADPDLTAHMSSLIWVCTGQITAAKAVTNLW